MHIGRNHPRRKDEQIRPSQQIFASAIGLQGKSMLHAEHGCKPCQYQENPPKQKGRLTSPAVHHQQIKHRRRRNQLYINKHIIKLPFQVEVHRPQHKGSQIQLEPGAHILINSHCRQIGNEDSSNPSYHPSAGRFLRLPVLQGIIGGHPRKEKKYGYRVKENIRTHISV